MIQTFDIQGGPAIGRAHVPLLRDELRRRNLDGVIVPHEDEYQNEYVPAPLDRLLWATGFTGSAGAAVVMMDRAAVFSDGRYTLQVRSQVDGDLFTYERLESGGVPEWLRTNLREGETVGYDPKLHSPKAVAKIREAVEGAGATLVTLDTHPVDAAWKDRPPLPTAPLTVQPDELAGESADSKRGRIAKTLRQRGADATVVTSPPSIAWLYNIRGGDVACTPCPCPLPLFLQTAAPPCS